jgi:hypothetical protein
MRRTSAGKRIEVSARDIELFKLLDRYRYLRSTFLHAFLGGSRNRFIERLGDLYHEGFLDRPVQQWQFANCRSMPVIYGLDRKGALVLRERGQEADNSSLPGKGYGGAPRWFSHQLMIADILASIELGVRENASLRFIGWRGILNRAPEATRSRAIPLAMPVSAHAARAGTVLIPDGLFGLEYDAAGAKTYRFFALEADRATMPVTRSDSRQTSYLKKLLAYRDIMARKAFHSQFGVPNLLVLTVTSNERHMRSIMAQLTGVTDGKGNTVFLFKTLSTLGDFQVAALPTPALLTDPWERVGHPAFRIDVH